MGVALTDAHGGATDKLARATGGVIAVRTPPVRPCLVHPKKQKVFKIFRHIKSYGTYMKH